MQKTRSEIMAETFEYYSNPKLRGLSEGGVCQYLTKEGNMCAVGRCLIDPSDSSLTDGFTGVTTVMVQDIPDLDSVLKEEYRGHRIDFWRELQMWHDNDKNFDSNGITEIGYNHIELMTEKYSE